MARLSKREVDKIVQRDLPGYTFAGRARAGPRDERSAEGASADVAPDIAKLRRKYLGESDTGAEDAAGTPAGGQKNTDDEIVVVQPKSRNAPFDHPSRPKTVVISGKKRRIIGSQG